MEARARVKAQIEADKRERAEKAARDKALREGKVDVATPAAPSKPLAAPPASTPSNASEARLRVRAPLGQWMGTLPAETTLAQLEAMVRDDGKAQGPLKVSFRCGYLQRPSPSPVPPILSAERLLTPSCPTPSPLFFRLAVLTNLSPQVLHG